MNIIKNIIKNISHIGDIIAIPFFILLTNYFYNIKDKNIIEYILFLFSGFALIADIFFTYLFFIKKR